MSLAQSILKAARSTISLTSQSNRWKRSSKKPLGSWLNNKTKKLSTKEANTVRKCLKIPQGTSNSKLIRTTNRRSSIKLRQQFTTSILHEQTKKWKITQTSSKSKRIKLHSFSKRSQQWWTTTKRPWSRSMKMRIKKLKTSSRRIKAACNLCMIWECDPKLSYSWQRTNLLTPIVKSINLRGRFKIKRRSWNNKRKLSGNSRRRSKNRHWTSTRKTTWSVRKKIRSTDLRRKPRSLKSLNSS